MIHGKPEILKGHEVGRYGKTSVKKTVKTHLPNQPLCGRVCVEQIIM